MKRQQGLSLIESLISSFIGLFIVTSSFLVINSTIMTSVASEKRVQLTEELDKKINYYILTGSFNKGSIEGNDFFKSKASSSSLVKFVGTNEKSRITVSKEVIKYNK
ncbi:MULTISPECIES: PulJ/GspJ family protein [unclassified Francisella]|uniref:PulJ/GspJ family protein n=1 Tax=unclassified Francisella TaxID=2610885 RepID=UPI002E342340|nr:MULTISPECIES: hypothetical protein [unclassified Francisella]MED7819880.1 hypothetical protein [Francisella sp. 19S2-4]MED7830702.1 hypothetical protein [Francisella sp. 19S2-10]